MTDLLDGWEDGSVELLPPAGMSPERIKEKTMEKIRQTKRPRRRMGVRLLACAALAAVFTVSAMAAYHLWGPGELFDPFFTLESAPLDGGQKELLDQIGVTDLPPVTSNGVTLTPPGRRRRRAHPLPPPAAGGPGGHRPARHGGTGEPYRPRCGAGRC